VGIYRGASYTTVAAARARRKLEHFNQNRILPGYSLRWGNGRFVIVNASESSYSETDALPFRTDSSKGRIACINMNVIKAMCEKFYKYFEISIQSHLLYL